MKFSLEMLLPVFLIVQNADGACANERISRKSTPPLTRMNSGQSERPAYTARQQQNQEDDGWGENVPGIAEYTVRRKQLDFLGNARCIYSYNAIIQSVEDDIIQLLRKSEDKMICFPRKRLSIFIWEPRLLVVSRWLDIVVGGSKAENGISLNPFECTLRIFPEDEFGWTKLDSSRYDVMSLIDNKGRPVDCLSETLVDILTRCGCINSISKDDFFTLFDIPENAASKIRDSDVPIAVRFPINWFIINLTDS